MKTATLPIHSRSVRKQHWIALVFLTVVIFASMGRLLAGDFTTWDDRDNIQLNEPMANPQIGSIRTILLEPHMDIYMPLTRLIWLALTGLQAPVPIGKDGFPAFSGFPFHLVNLLAHCGAAWLVYRLFFQLLSDFRAALLGALIWAVHPLQVEAVGWISGLKDVLCGGWMAMTLWLYAMHREQARSSPKSFLFIASCGALLLALFSKPAAMTTILLAAAMDLLHFKTPIKAIIRDLSIWALLITPFAIVARVIQNARLAQPGPIYLRPLVAGDSLAHYLYRLVFPHDLTMDYGRNPNYVFAHGYHHWTWIAPVAVLLTAILLRKRINLLLPVAFFYLAALHTLGLVKFDFQLFSTVADHYCYVMVMGAGLAVAMVLHHFKYRAMAVVTLGIGALLAVLSFNQTAYWLNTNALMTRGLALNPNSVPASQNTARLLVAKGDYKAATELLEKCVAFEPRFYVTEMYLANLYLDMNEFDRAKAHFENGLNILVTYTGPESELTTSSLLHILELWRAKGKPDMIRHFAAWGLKAKGKPLPEDLPPLPATQSS